MAYGIMRKLLEEAGIADIEVKTAGVMTIPGLIPTQECRQILQNDGMCIDHLRSCQLTPELIRRARIIFGMTSFHVQMALRVCEEARGKTFLLKEFAGSDPKNGQIQDPMGCTLEVYRKVYREIRAACKRLMKRGDILKAPFFERASPSRPRAGKGATARPKDAKTAAGTGPGRHEAPAKEAAVRGAGEKDSDKPAARKALPKKAEKKKPAAKDAPSKEPAENGAPKKRTASPAKPVGGETTPKKKPTVKKPSAKGKAATQKAPDESGPAKRTAKKSPAAPRGSKPTTSRRSK